MKKPQYRRYTRSKAGNFFFFLFLIAAGLFSVLPMIYSIVTSFKPLDELMIFPPKFFVNRPTLMNYTSIPRLLSSLQVPVSRYVFNSVFLAVVTTTMQVIVASMAAYAISKLKLNGTAVLFIIIQFALMYNATTLAIPQYIIFTKVRIINTYLVYILPYLQSSMGVFLMKQFVDDGVPDVLLEAARMDGAGPFRIYWKIVMPCIKPAWLTLTLFSFNDTWSFGSGATIFDEQLKTLPAIMSQISSGGIARMGNAMAAAMLLAIPPIALYLITQSNVIETMSSAGIKE